MTACAPVFCSRLLLNAIESSDIILIVICDDEYTFNCHLPQLFDPNDNIGGRWTRFNQGKKVLKPDCSATRTFLIILLGFLSTFGVMHHEKQGVHDFFQRWRHIDS